MFVLFSAHSMEENMIETEVDEYRIEIENRIKNLMWTVSGDYSLNITPDVESFKISKYISLYDAVKQGAFSKYFNRDELSMYIVKKVFMSADEDFIVYISQMCVDAAVRNKICCERPGVENIKIKAYEDILDKKFDKMSSSFLGQVKIQLLKNALGYSDKGSGRVDKVVKIIEKLEDTNDIMDVIKAVDIIYNDFIDRTFQERHGDLEKILAVTMDELSEYNWNDFLNDEMYEDMLEQYLNDVTDSLTDMTNTREEKKNQEQEIKKARLRVYDKKQIEKIYSYVELNYGKSYLSENEHKRINKSICNGIHADCSLYFTEGILKNPVKVNYQYKYSQMLVSGNRMEYNDKRRVINKNISVLTDTLRHSIIFRNQREFVKSDSGNIIPSSIWKIGRTSDIRLFNKEIKKDNSEFVVEILMDASGSQSKRQPQVAVQGYIISAALSNAGIPHRVMGFCTFWNYTVMQRYRDYDDGKEADIGVLEYTASANNRDGLAIRAAAESLKKREEDNKILIVLSDGKPNDSAIAREGVGSPKPYIGESGVRDTALEVRKIRSMGISILGVYTGTEEDLNAEKNIFGKDFAYIRNINNFANIVSIYLKKQIIDN